MATPNAKLKSKQTNATPNVQVEPERVRSCRLGGVPPQLAHPSEAVAGPDALHVGEHLGRDIQVRIEDRLLDRQGYGYPRGALGRHGRARRRVGGAAFSASSWLFLGDLKNEGRKIKLGK